MASHNFNLLNTMPTSRFFFGLQILHEHYLLYFIFFADQEGEHLLVVDVEPEVKFLIRNLTTEGSGVVGGEGVQRSILNGINAEIPKGMVVGIIGPSGGGKSTLLRALNRLWEPPPHTVFLDGQDICGVDVLTLRRKVGMLFQIPALFEGTKIKLTIRTAPLSQNYF